MGDLGSIPGLGRSPGEGKDYPLQYSGLENSMDQSTGSRRVGHNRATFTFTFKATLFQWKLIKNEKKKKPTSAPLFPSSPFPWSIVFSIYFWQALLSLCLCGGCSLPEKTVSRLSVGTIMDMCEMTSSRFLASNSSQVCRKCTIIKSMEHLRESLCFKIDFWFNFYCFRACMSLN